MKKDPITILSVMKTVGRDNIGAYLRTVRELRQMYSKQILVWQLNNKKVGKRLREMREDSGWSLREMAKLLQLSAPFLSDCELGERQLGILHTMLFLFYCEKGPK